jgi:hypothetical protein
MSDQSGMSAMTEKGALDLAIAQLQRRVKDRDAEIGVLRAALEPFARVSRAHPNWEPADRAHTDMDDDLHAADFHRAAAALDR